MARDFMTVYKNIIAVAPEELVEKLEKSEGFWAPEMAWTMLSETVNRFVAPSSSSAQSIAIYAELCGLEMAEMKAKFKESGL